MFRYISDTFGDFAISENECYKFEYAFWIFRIGVELFASLVGPEKRHRDIATCYPENERPQIR